MGYNTDFNGSFKPDRPFTFEEANIINDFARERHGTNLKPYDGFPGFNCHWAVNRKGEIAWDGGECFYEYGAWLVYLVENFFIPWDVKLNGEVTWQGEEQGDIGKIVAKNNVVSLKKAKISYE